MVYPELEKVFPFFGDLPERSRRRLLQGLRPRRAEEGEILNREGCCGSIPLVEEGVLRVYQVDDTGRELTLFRAQAGDACLLPLACGYLDGGLPVVVQAQEACRLLLIPEEMYEAELKDNPVWKDFVIGSLYRRLSQTVQVLEQTAFSGLDRRLARTLWRLSGGEEGRIAVTHEQLAAELGTVWEVVSRLLGELRRRGILQQGRGQLFIQDADKLRRLAEL